MYIHAKEHSMSKVKQSRQLGIIGGILIAIAALLVGTGFDFDTAGLKNPETLVLFAAGLGVIFFLLAGQMPWAIYSTIAAATIALIWILGLIMVDGTEITLKLVLLVIGVILALLATTWHRRG
jgi:hypothetical protein